jgi:hypothetical protein
VLTFRGREIAQVDAFIVRATEEERNEMYARFPEMAADPQRLEGAFGRFGLPDRID